MPIRVASGTGFRKNPVCRLINASGSIVPAANKHGRESDEIRRTDKDELTVLSRSANAMQYSPLSSPISTMRRSTAFCLIHFRAAVVDDTQDTAKPALASAKRYRCRHP